MHSIWGFAGCSAGEVLAKYARNYARWLVRGVRRFVLDVYTPMFYCARETNERGLTMSFFEKARRIQSEAEAQKARDAIAAVDDLEERLREQRTDFYAASRRLKGGLGMRIYPSVDLDDSGAPRWGRFLFVSGDYGSLRLRWAIEDGYKMNALAFAGLPMAFYGLRHRGSFVYLAHEDHAMVGTDMLGPPGMVLVVTRVIGKTTFVARLKSMTAGEAANPDGRFPRLGCPEWVSVVDAVVDTEKRLREAREALTAKVFANARSGA